MLCELLGKMAQVSLAAIHYDRIINMATHMTEGDLFQAQSERKKYWLDFDPEHWRRLSSPFRPSREDIDNFLRLLPCGLTGSKVAVLGATPELRDLVVERKGRPCVVDFSLQMLSGMAQYCKYAAGHEDWCLNDWRALDFPDGSFQWVMGDLILRALPAEDHAGFLEGAARVLTDSGCLIVREHILDESLRTASVTELLGRARLCNSREGLSASALGGQAGGHWSGRPHVVSLLMDKYADPAARVMNRGLAARKLDEEEGHISNPDVRELLRSAAGFLRTGPDWSISTKRQMEDALSRRFEIMNVLAPRDHLEGRHYPVYLLKKRSGEK